jgi:putative ABC transport system permease protein
VEIRPILSAMLRNRTGAVLIALQIAVTLAVVTNAAHIIKQRLDLIGRPTGLDVAHIFQVQSVDFSEHVSFSERVRADLELLRGIPGVRVATAIGSMPLSGGGSATEYYVEAGKDESRVAANYFTIDEQGLETLGVKLVAGRDFRPEDVDFYESTSGKLPASIIVTDALAKRLFPDGNALGSTVYDGLGQPQAIVGIVEHMHGSWVDAERVDEVVLRPQIYDGNFVRYAVRTEPGRRDEVMAVVEQKLTMLDPQRVVRGLHSLEEIASDSYGADRAMAILLTTVIALLIAVTALGIVGLASFSVKSRTKQIGTRRAIGATRPDIIRYFMVENWLITTGGVALGSVLALAFNVWLVRTFELPKLEVVYIPLGIVTLWVLGLIAVLGPARRAASIAPAIATRTV